MKEYWSKTLKEGSLRDDLIPLPGDEEGERKEGADGIVMESNNSTHSSGILTVIRACLRKLEYNQFSCFREF